MPAITVAHAANMLSEYVRPDEDFLKKLNFVMPRLYALGYWRDLVSTEVITTDLPYVPVPEGYEAVIRASVGNIPQKVQAEWQDYLLYGTDLRGSGEFFGLVDDGFHPTMVSLDYANALHTIKLCANCAAEGTVTIEYVDTNGAAQSVITELTGSSGEALISSPDSLAIDRITLIQFDNVFATTGNKPVRLVALRDSDGVEFSLAYGRGSEVKRYRRFRIPNPASTTPVTMLLKRAWVPVSEADDLIYLGNINAIKHSLLGMIAEDNADLQRAAYHWQVCEKLLEDEKATSQGAARPKPNVQPFGDVGTIGNQM